MINSIDRLLQPAAEDAAGPVTGLPPAVSPRFAQLLRTADSAQKTPDVSKDLVHQANTGPQSTSTVLDAAGEAVILADPALPDPSLGAVMQPDIPPEDHNPELDWIPGAPVSDTSLAAEDASAERPQLLPANAHFLEAPVSSKALPSGKILPAAIAASDAEAIPATTTVRYSEDRDPALFRQSGTERVSLSEIPASQGTPLTRVSGAISQPPHLTREIMVDRSAQVPLTASERTSGADQIPQPVAARAPRDSLDASPVITPTAAIARSHSDALAELIERAGRTSARVVQTVAATGAPSTSAGAIQNDPPVAPRTIAPLASTSQAIVLETSAESQSGRWNGVVPAISGPDARVAIDRMSQRTVNDTLTPYSEKTERGLPDTTAVPLESATPRPIASPQGGLVQASLSPIQSAAVPQSMSTESPLPVVTATGVLALQTGALVEVDSSAARVSERGGVSAPTPATPLQLAIGNTQELGERLGALLGGGRSLRSISGSQFSIALAPAELGRLEIKISNGADHTLQLAITTQHAGTRDLVEAQLHRLRSALDEQGYDKVQFDLRDERGERSGQQPQRESNQERWSQQTEQPHWQPPTSAGTPGVFLSGTASYALSNGIDAYA